MKTAILILTVALGAAFSAPRVVAQEPSAGPGVVVSEARIKSFPLSSEALGNTRANESVDLRPEITAAITEIRFVEGSHVEQGEVLVTLENSEQLADLAAAKAALVDSQSQFRRSSELFKTRAVAASQMEQLEAQRDADQAAVAAAQARLAQTVIRAPFAGELGLRRVSLGSIVDPSTVITTLDDRSRIKLDFNVPEVFLSRLEPGLTVTASSAAWPDARFSGTVVTIDTRVDPVSRTIMVRAILPNDDGRLRPGMFLTVTLLKEDVVALMVPEQALVPERSKQYVYVVGSDLTVELREVWTGRRRPGEVEITGGLQAGEQVIAEGTQIAMPGSRVKIVGRLEG
ncbi:MAG: efflux RND transporter periplasmic adaptor subunit [Xanthomonadales bacterium]|nr:efflux RND transporter periplasmic adaptor subunit [Xanthomonadales bacterium]